MSEWGVRRDKAALSSGCKPHPATAPAGSNRSSHGGNEVAEAFGWRVTIYGNAERIGLCTSNFNHRGNEAAQRGEEAPRIDRWKPILGRLRSGLLRSPITKPSPEWHR